VKSTVKDTMPPRLRRSLAKFGADITVARKKRSLTVAMMAERLGAAASTYSRVEKGDPTVSMGTYAMALFVLGFGECFAELVDPRRDDQGLLLDHERLPQRVRVKKQAKPL
jgi:transcriptional regulator with XRE-family HTH domain